jgi:hypothetical protein
MPNSRTLQRRFIKNLTDGSVWDRLNETFKPSSTLYIAISIMLACSIIYLVASMKLQLG